MSQPSDNEQYQSRVELVAWLISQTRGCDENGDYDHEEDMKWAMRWWELSDEQLLQATEYILLGQKMQAKVRAGLTDSCIWI